jgi:ribosome biogenesis GTPase
MSILQSYGWNDHFNNLYTNSNHQHLEAGRVMAILAFKYVLITETGKLDTLLSGALMNNNEPEAYPKVGDWVLFKRYDAEGIILEVLPRMNELSRKAPGAATARQVLAVNIDAAFIVQGVDRDFNPMRLQRYIQQVQQCGIQPIVLLNKADLVPDPQEFVRAVEELGYGCPVYLASALDKASQEQWAATYLQPGKTYILLGSSGVGKSTLLNAWLGYQLQQEGATSTSNSKGKHTTTARNLMLLSNGSLVIDAPGMREFGMTLEDDAATVSHPLIDELADQCRFRDCSHQQEPGCAVIAAVGNGNLPQAVYRSYLKLLREQYHYQASAADKKRNERQFGKISKQVFAHRKKYKY